MLIRLKSFFIAFRDREEIRVLGKDFYLVLFVSSLLCFLVLIFGAFKSDKEFINPFTSPLADLKPIEKNKGQYEIFGFAPYWTFSKLDNIDFNLLTTLAYFGVPVDANGNLDKSDYGYEVFQSEKATKLFTKAHNAGTRVVLTLTQMDGWSILNLMDNEDAKNNAIDQVVSEIQGRGIDGINVDFEYSGNPGDDYRNKFTKFVEDLTKGMHLKIPSSKVTVSVYAASVKDPKIYDIGALARVSDGIFMMAYDFAVLADDNAIPTAPLYGHREGKYWYDVSTAVSDFLKQMPPQKLILGVPWYSYNYLVNEPSVKAETLPYYSWKGRPKVQTYADVVDEIKPDMQGIQEYKTGWDKYGQVNWKAYYVSDVDAWRMVFYDDAKSLGIKFDFAKNKNLGGIGIWALGFDNGKREFWKLLEEKFGLKLADNSVLKKVIYEDNENI
ncbi:MAG: glycoside hydrolase family 18 protein [Candidatus Levybacteria bacterium]|nr:glycoside hydrolase family 18 protein [Candidatus Levybacteria bacterium]